MATDEWSRALKRQTLRLALYEAFGLLPSEVMEAELAKRLRAKGKFTSALSFVNEAQRHSQAMAAEWGDRPVELQAVPIPQPVKRTRSK